MAVTTNRPPIIYYTCGEPGHISRRCLKKDDNVNNGVGIPNQAANIDPNLLQGLLKQIGAQNSTPTLN